jgi:aryl-alcohol dehydrogenase-like predicted oxidoreductase
MSSVGNRTRSSLSSERSSPSVIPRRGASGPPVTAAVYGRRYSEEIVGRAVKPWMVGEEVFVFTKCGRNFYDGSAEISSNLHPEVIRWECDQSLGRLGIERIDLLQFHWPDPTTDTAIEDSGATLGDLIEEGKVRWAGVSNFDVDLLDRCEAIRHVDSFIPR